MVITQDGEERVPQERIILLQQGVALVLAVQPTCKCTD